MAKMNRALRRLAIYVGFIDGDSQCTARTKGLLGVELVCDRPAVHAGDHHDADTGATWARRSRHRTSRDRRP